MQENPDFYDFCGVRLFLIDTHIEIIATGKHFTPSKNHRAFLLGLVRDAPNVVSYQKLWKEVWHLDEMSDTDLRNIQTTKGNLVGWLKSIGIKEPPIEPVPGKGYRLNCEVFPGWFDDKQSNLFQKGSNQDVPEKIASDIFTYNVPSNAVEFVVTGNNFQNNSVYSNTDVSDRFLKDAQTSSQSMFKSLSNKNLIFGIIVAAIITIGLLMQNDKNENPDILLHSAEFVSKPIPKNQFFLRLTGKNIPAETVHLNVVGPGCGGDAPCVVPNGALRLYGQITESSIEKAPLTVVAGEYQIWLENEANNSSNKLTISIPETDL